MNASPSLSAPARRWPVVALCFASALGAMYCAALWALAYSLVGSPTDALGQWGPIAMRYLAGLIACLALFLGSGIWLRRDRTRDGAGVREPAI
jgi:hypothetical protein